MAATSRVEHTAVAAANRWLDAVTPQLGVSANYAQVDIDTLLSVRGGLKRELAHASVAMFRALVESTVVVDRGWFVELSVPIDHGQLPDEPVPGTDVGGLLDQLSFSGSLRGRQVPGFWLFTWIPGDRIGPLSQHRVRVAWDDVPDCVVHYRSELWGEEEPAYTWRERALEFRRYPAKRDFHEAVFP